MDSMLKKTSPLRMALAGVLVASGVLLIAWSGIEGGGVELLTVHSASYYEGLARADQWQAGPANVNMAVQSSGSSSTSGFARTQALTEVDGGEEGGSRGGKRGRLSESLIKACSQGDNSACNKIADDPSQVAQLRRVVDGGSGGHATEISRRSSRSSSGKMGAMLPPRAAAADASASFSGVGAAGVGSNGKQQGLWNTRGSMWDSKRWQSGGVDDVVSNQWLNACTNGDYDACKHIGSSSSALHALLEASAKAGGKPVADFEEPASVPRPVYAIPSRGKHGRGSSGGGGDSVNGGFFGSLMADLGLGDTFTKQSGTARAPPKMVPDVGLDGRGDKSGAMWNDGTVAEGLSDVRGGRAAAVKDIKGNVEAAASRVKAAADKVTQGINTVFSDAKGGPRPRVQYHM